MALDYNLTQTGEEVQEALDQVPVTQAELQQETQDRADGDAAERERAEAVEQELRDMIEQGGGGTPSQEVIEMINTVAADGSRLSLEMTPNLVFAGEPNNISLTARTSEYAESIRIYHAGYMVGEGFGYKLTVSDSTIMSQEGNSTYTAEFTIGGKRKTTTAVLEAVRPCYYGVGSNYTAATQNMGIKKSPAGFYDIDVSVAGSRIYVVVPSTMTVNRVRMSGVDVPFDAPANVVVNGTAYKAYRSSNTYDIENLTIEIQ